MSEYRTLEGSRTIASDKVEGTAVYNREGEKLGSISRFMVDKLSGKVDYAELSFGGLFGLGKDYYPLPWDVLTYDQDKGGYVIDLDKDLLEGAPRYAADEEQLYDDAYGRQVYGYYNVPYPY